MMFRIGTLSLVLATITGILTATAARPATVKTRVNVSREGEGAHADHDAGVVLWLTTVYEVAPLRASISSPHPQLVQKNKRFEPHILAVQAGSIVDFPNHDPFFHNVFSLFDGKRFDLGLYEAGATRSVRFDKAGICYIFCNIHPQMSAVVVVVNTPYFGVSGSSGEIEIDSVPAGRYELNVWEEHCLAKNLAELSRPVMVGGQDVSLGTIRLRESQELVKMHPNKYGKAYDPQVFSSPIYLEP